MIDKLFYRAFEEQHRGPRKLILSRLQVYLPFVLPLKKIYCDPQAVDLGCGRGEWLELLEHHNISAKGIDLDSGMLLDCHKLGLNAIEGDAIRYLEKLPNESQICVSGFHIAEHLKFEDLQTVVAEALRVLKPGGLLILETPNPENIVVGSSNFYMDPTHIKPIPQKLLAFLSTYHGYKRTKIIRLQESISLNEKTELNFMNILGDVSPDYAVISQKKADAAILASTELAFNKEYGISLQMLTEKYNENSTRKTEKTEIQIQEIAKKITKIETQAQEILARYEKLEHAEAQARNQSEQIKTQVQEIIARYKKADALCYALYHSRSWRMTYPLRQLSKFIGWLTKSSIAWLTFTPKSWVRRTLRKILLKLHQHISAHPALKIKLMKILNHFPKFNARLKQSLEAFPQDTHELSPHARAIYAQLKAAMDQKQEHH